MLMLVPEVYSRPMSYTVKLVLAGLQGIGLGGLSHHGWYWVLGKMRIFHVSNEFMSQQGLIIFT